MPLEQVVLALVMFIRLLMADAAVGWRMVIYL
jgi:hypothetical protein